MVRRQWMRLPRLVRFLLVHAANGMVIGCLVVFGLIWLDVGGLGRLLAASGLATFVLFFQVALTFGSVSMAVAVMRLGKD